MKVHLAAILLVLIISATASGQRASSAPWSLNGLVVNATPTSRSARFKKERKAEVGYKLDLYLQLRNDSDEPLIFFVPDGFAVKKRVVFLKSENLDDMSVVVTTPWTSKFAELYDYYEENGYSRFRSALTGLDATSPSNTDFVVIQPGSYYEFRDTIFLKEGYSMERKSGESTRGIEKKIASGDYPALRIEYSVSPKDHRENDDILLEAAKRWRGIGRLVLTGEEFTLVSQPFLNKWGN